MPVTILTSNPLKIPLTLCFSLIHIHLSHFKIIIPHSPSLPFILSSISLLLPLINFLRSPSPSLFIFSPLPHSILIVFPPPLTLFPPPLTLFPPPLTLFVSHSNSDVPPSHYFIRYLLVFFLQYVPNEIRFSATNSENHETKPKTVILK